MTLNENDVVTMFGQEFSWEQILYKIIAVEGMDPWDVNLSLLSDRFAQSIEKAETLNFKIPAKYIIISSVILRMKAEHLDIVQDILSAPPEQLLQAAQAISSGTVPPLLLNPLSIPPNRTPLRKVMVEELIDALRKALKTSERREQKEVVAREKIDIRPENLTARITALYGRITSALLSFKQQEVLFSDVVGKWDRQHILDNFIPLVYLDHNKKVEIRQEEFFKEIFVKKREETAVQVTEAASEAAGRNQEAGAGVQELKK